MRLRWVIFTVAFAVGIGWFGVIPAMQEALANCPNCTVLDMDVYALDYFTAHRLPRTGFDYETVWSEWSGALASGQSWGFNYTQPLRENLNLSNLYLSHVGDDALQSEAVAGGGVQSWDLSMIGARSRTINFTVTDDQTGNVSLALGRKPWSGYNYGTSYNATIVDVNGTLLSAFYYQLPDGDNSTSLLPLTDLTVPLNLSAGGYTLKIDYWLYAYDSMPVYYKVRYNYYLNDPILIRRYVTNAPPILDSLSDLNTSYHISSSVVGRALDDLGVYSVRISSGKHGTTESTLTRHPAE